MNTLPAALTTPMGRLVLFRKRRRLQTLIRLADGVRPQEGPVEPLEDAHDELEDPGLL